MSLERYRTPEVYIMFHPNPQSMPSYGRILVDTLLNTGVEETFVSSNTSKYTFLLSPLNHQFPYTTIAFPIYCAFHHVDAYKYDRSLMVDAQTQTEDSAEGICSSELYHSIIYSSLYSKTSSLAPVGFGSLFDQPPPPYPYQRQIKTEPLYAERYERRPRRYARQTVNTAEGIDSDTMSTQLNNKIEYSQPQFSRNRRQRCNTQKPTTRRSRGETKNETTSSAAQNQSSTLNSEEFDLIDEIIAKDLNEN